MTRTRDEPHAAAHERRDGPRRGQKRQTRPGSPKMMTLPGSSSALFLALVASANAVDIVRVDCDAGDSLAAAASRLTGVPEEIVVSGTCYLDAPLNLGAKASKSSWRGPATLSGGAALAFKEGDDGLLVADAKKFPEVGGRRRTPNVAVRSSGHSSRHRRGARRGYSEGKTNAPGRRRSRGRALADAGPRPSRGASSRRRRGYDVDSPRRRVAATPRLPRG